MPPIRSIISRIVSFCQMTIFILPFLIGKIEFIRNHPFYQAYEQKKFMFLIGGYFLLNMIQTQVSSTGAFEIYLDNTLIFSKLATGRMPNIHEISSYLRWILLKMLRQSYDEDIPNTKDIFGTWLLIIFNYLNELLDTITKKLFFFLWF